MKGFIVLVGAIVVLTGCVSRSATSQGGWYDLSEVDSPPYLSECTLHEPPPPSIGTVRTARVEVSFSVDESGAVVGAVPRLLTTRLGAGGVTGRALQVVNSCRYTPAVLDGQPVSVRGLRRLFSFALEIDQ